MKNYIYPLMLSAIVILGACNQNDPNPEPTPTTVGTKIDDTVITTKVKSALLNDENVKSFDIAVETRKGVVMLSGYVDSLSQVEQAMAVTRGVEGVVGVDNGMTIKDGNVSIGNKIDDSVITTKVKTALMGDDTVKGADITVDTSKGEVQLSGFVNNKTQIERAIQVARTVEGVQNVLNKMTVKE
ncbi:MAG: BON domain-containing protein [Gammaproteobacteria bacterium]|nr:BON domain-containing protein [Gammaproteobacteria bacterium]